MSLTTRQLLDKQEKLRLQMRAMLDDAEGDRMCAELKDADVLFLGNHGVIVYTVNSLYLVQNMPNAKLILYPDANHGSWYENHEDFVFEANRFLNDSDRIATVTTGTADD